ncbi:hypothetical protein [Natronomonas sp. EA1]|uniref:hypothetical protein n=1 Tax=Natronomonas sp. EA1 TaxID=3421655 RepID=UPI003EC14184
MGDASPGSAPPVGEYFGDLIADVALDAPVSRVMLTTALERLQAASSHLATMSDATFIHVGETEEVYVIPLADWKALADVAGLSVPERHAAREVHRRLAVSLAGDRVVGHGPFIRISKRKTR